VGDLYETRVDSEYRISRREGEVCSGVYPWCVDYERDGFFVFEEALTPLYIESLLRNAKSIENDNDSYKISEPDSDVTRSVLSIHNEICFESFLLSKLCRHVSGCIVDSGYVHQSRINYKYPKESAGWSWHSDFETWHSQDGMPRMEAFNFMIPLVDNHERNGCLNVIPGSHKYFISTERGGTFSSEENFRDQKVGVPTGDAIKNIVELTGNSPKPIECKAGDVVVFDCNLLHCSDANLSDECRVNLFFVINDGGNKLSAPYNYSFNRPEEMAARKSIKEI